MLGMKQGSICMITLRTSLTNGWSVLRLVLLVYHLIALVLGINCTGMAMRRLVRKLLTWEVWVTSVCRERPVFKFCFSYASDSKCAPCRYHRAPFFRYCGGLQICFLIFNSHGLMSNWFNRYSASNDDRQRIRNWGDDQNA